MKKKQMINTILFLLLLLFIKHWYVDFVNQNNEEVTSKGIYGDFNGIMHSLKHGVATLVCILIVTGTSYPSYVFYAITLGLLDFVVHYHIDWIKMNYGNRDIRTPQFWNHLGLDQLAHYITYLFIVRMIV
jgi:hypothetical protein